MKKASMDSRGERPPAEKPRNRPVTANGECLRALRIARGWTQRDAARRAGVSDRLIRKAESGAPLGPVTIRILADLYESPEAAITSSGPPRGPAGPSQVSSAAAMLRRFFDEVWNRGNLGVIDEMLHPEIQYHNESGVVHNREEMRERFQKLRECFSDFEAVVQQITDHDQFVVCRWRIALTHSGAWLDLAPTHRRVVVHGSTWVEIADGKFGGRAWDFWDPGLLYQQLAGTAENPE